MKISKIQTTNTPNNDKIAFKGFWNRLSGENYNHLLSGAKKLGQIADVVVMERRPKYKLPNSPQEGIERIIDIFVGINGHDNWERVINDSKTVRYTLGENNIIANLNEMRRIMTAENNAVSNETICSNTIINRVLGGMKAKLGLKKENVILHVPDEAKKYFSEEIMKYFTPEFIQKLSEDIDANKLFKNGVLNIEFIPGGLSLNSNGTSVSLVYDKLKLIKKVPSLQEGKKTEIYEKVIDILPEQDIQNVQEAMLNVVRNSI